MVKNVGTIQKVTDAGFGVDVYNDVVKKRDIRYHNLLSQNNAILPNVYNVIKNLAQEYQLCIITSSLRKHFEVIHKQTDLLPFFNIIICNEDVKKTKPDPEPYLKALEKSGYAPEEAVVIEDSQRGLISAQRAGIQSVAIPGHLNKNGDFTEATYKIDNILELPELLKKL
jgi:HAD superfamily hydrolase (TIGR01509 family)